MRSPGRGSSHSISVWHSSIRRTDGSLLIWVNGDGGHVTRFYVTSTPDLRDPALQLTLLQTWDPASPEDFGSDVNPVCEGSDWPTDTDAYQGSAFVRQADGRLFLVTAWAVLGHPMVALVAFSVAWVGSVIIRVLLVKRLGLETATTV